MYRTGIELGELPGSYKNLGLFYWERDGDPAEIVSLWETYLASDPDDPQVGDIQQAIEVLNAQR